MLISYKELNIIFIIVEPQKSDDPNSPRIVKFVLSS